MVISLSLTGIRRAAACEYLHHRKCVRNSEIRFSYLHHQIVAESGPPHNRSIQSVYVIGQPHFCGAYFPVRYFPGKI